MNANQDRDPIEDFADTVSDVRARIEAHKSYISGHETRTRALLIDPLLNSMGWCITNPDRVQLEAPNETGRVPDYVLLGANDPFAVVEAKALGKLKVADSVAQVSSYIWQPSLSKAEVAVLTDGETWHFRRKPDLSKATKQGKISISDGEVWKVVFELNRHLEWSKFEGSSGVGAHRAETEGGRSTESDGRQRWYSLTSDLPDTQPAGLRFEDGSEYELPSHNWRQAYLQVAKHLVSVGKINAGNVPISLTRTEKYAVHAEAVHSNGDAFSNPADIGAGLWIDRPNTHSSLRYSLRLLNHCGVDPDRVMIRFE